jgi:Helix-turn-helix domain
MTEREAFGPSLRSERERRGITLEAIARSTKINKSLLAALERNDLSRWPKGIFGRSFVRAYASFVGLPTEPTVARFVRLFPEGGPLDQVRFLAEDGGLRLTLEPEPSWTQSDSGRHWLAAVVDSVAILIVATAITLGTRADPWKVAAAVALGYYALTTALLGCSAASWWLGRGWSSDLLSRRTFSLHPSASADDFLSAPQSPIGTT